MGYIQQGDVLIKRIEKFDEKRMEKKIGGVLQEGETTGHAHRLSGDGFTIFQEPTTKQRFLRVVKTTPLTHEEHKEFDIPPGDYVIDIVREYDHFEEETRRVLD